MLLICLPLFYIIMHTTSAQKQDDACLRPCNGNTKICQYEFIIEPYLTLSSACRNCPEVPSDCFLPECIVGDGFMKKVRVANRRMPGPMIEVCEGDDVSIIVQNRLHSDTTVIHWHGMHQVGTPYMDGVPFVTQCPSLPGTSFKYRFRASPAGTHFWHSHSKSMQKGSGIFGALIVRKKLKADANPLYDYDLSEHVILLSDSAELDAHDQLLRITFGALPVGQIRSILVNGVGRFTNIAQAIPTVPAARFVVKEGFKYRFRLISAVHTNSAIKVSIDGHRFIVISSDGNDIQPILTDSVTILSGERYDIVVEANQVAGLYWMRFQGLMTAAGGRAHQAAVLEYFKQSNTSYPEGTPTYLLADRQGQQVNGLSSLTNNIRVGEFRSVAPVNYNNETPDYKFYITIDSFPKEAPIYQLYPAISGAEKLPIFNIPQIMQVSLELFPFSLLTQRNQIQTNSFCNESTISPRCKQEYCTCPHVLKVRKDALVELILIDEGTALSTGHPIHLHGQYFAVLGSDTFGTTTTKQYVIDQDNAGQLKRNFDQPPLKDVVAVPDGGYVVVRFTSNNPGFWLLHCHAETHIDLGMAMVIQIGEFSEMAEVPKGFPTCGDYLET